MARPKNTERNKEIVRLRKEGLTLEEIAKIHRITDVRVMQILREESGLCQACGKPRNEEV